MNHNRFQTLFESMSQGVVFQDSKGVITSANPAAQRILGLSLDQMQGLTSVDERWKSIHEDGSNYPGDTHPAMLALKTGKKIVNQIMGIFHPEKNSFVWLEIDAEPHFKPGEKTPFEVFSTFTDITRQKISEEKNRAWIEHSPACTKIVDLDFNLQYMSSSGISGLNIDDIDEFYGKPYPLHFYPDSFKTPMIRNLKKVKETGTIVKQEASVLSFDGEELWYHSTLVPVNDKNDELDHIMIVSLDITERKRVENELQKSHSLMASIIESPDNIIIFALDKDYNYVSFNEAHKVEMKKIYNADIQIGQFIFSYMPNKEDQLKAEVNYKRVLCGERFIVIQKYGFAEKRIWYELSFNPIKDNTGIVSGFTIFSQNITARRQAEEDKLNFEKQIQHSQKLESLGVLAGGIAHDFNNILMGIMGYTDLAMYEIRPVSPAYEYVQGIGETTRKAAGLVKQMLAYSGKGKFSLEPIDLNEVIEETVQMLNVSISKKAVVKYNFSPTPVLMEGDPAQLRQIIMNLTINASEAIEEKSGVIALTTGTMYCDRRYIDATGFEAQLALTNKLREGMYGFLEVSDTGIGMSKQTINRIFEPFFTTKFTGRGLGLSAILGIVRGHHGIVKIYSELGKGTTFKILFPLFDNSGTNSSKSVATNDKSMTWQGQGLFLIADDEEAIRSVAKHMIQKLGFEILTAENGREAIEVFSQHADKIVGVLLDLTMPHKDGAEVYQAIKQLNPDINVILSSGYNEQDATQKFIGKGLAGFIQKPYGSADLLKKIIEVMS